MRPAAGIVLLALALATPEIRYFQYQRVLQQSAQAGQACVALDAKVYEHGAPDLADLRLYADPGGSAREVPYALRTTEAVEADKAIVPMNLGLKKGQTVFDAAMPPGKYSDLELDVTGQNFLATVSVSGSQSEAAAEATKIGGYTIFDLSRQKLGRSTVLHLPVSDFRFLHFRISGASGAAITPENVTGLSVMRVPVRAPQFVTVSESTKIEKAGRNSSVEFVVPAHVPVDRVAFVVGAEPAMFSREVTVHVEPAEPPSDADTASPQTSSGTILRIHRDEDGHRIDEERLQVQPPQILYDKPTKWTVSVDNGDDAPLQISAVRLQMLQRELCFAGDAQTDYALFYGDPALAAPHYDYARLFHEQADAMQSAEGPEQSNPKYQARPDARPFTERHPGLLWAALVGVIVLLGGIAVRSFARKSPVG